MHSNPFRFKQFLIHHDRCAMKVGTDGVLLGAWANLDNAKTVLDIGTGSGLIALMAAQRNNASIIDAVEIDESSYMQASENVRLSKWHGRIHVHNQSIQRYFTGHHYDKILSNPPYFGNGVRPKGSAREKARSTDYLSPQDLMKNVNRLLASSGSFHLIYPYQESFKVIKLAENHGLNVSKKLIVFSRAGMSPERILLEFKRKRYQIEEGQLNIYQSGKHKKAYTQEYISLTKDFYLNM